MLTQNCPCQDDSTACHCCASMVSKASGDRASSWVMRSCACSGLTAYSDFSWATLAGRLPDPAPPLALCMLRPLPRWPPLTSWSQDAWSFSMAATVSDEVDVTVSRQTTQPRSRGGTGVPPFWLAAPSGCCSGALVWDGSSCPVTTMARRLLSQLSPAAKTQHSQHQQPSRA